MQRIPSLFFTESPLGGRGVFTAAAIPQGALIEICPVVVIPGGQLPLIDQTVIYNYYFLWGEEDEHCAMALGYGSLYNHSFEPNARYDADFEGLTFHFFALRDIEAGEEIVVNYNGDPEDKDAIWFQPD